MEASGVAAVKRPREEGTSKENSPTNGQVSLVTPCMQFGNSSAPFLEFLLMVLESQQSRLCSMAAYLVS